jgi:hypothetical protein
VAAPAPLRAAAPPDAKASAGPRPLAGAPPANAAANAAANAPANAAANAVANAPATRAVETDAATTPRRTEPPSPGLLLRRSPWLPDVPTDRAGDELAALRFHADGTADLLRHRPGTDRYDPMPGSYVAWRLDGATLRLAIVGDAFSATCTGTSGPQVAGAAARAEPRAGTATRASTSSSSLAASSRSAKSGTSATSSSTSASSAASAPQPRAFGDWHALDVRRLESASPLSGRMCAQTLARDAALAACRADLGCDCQLVAIAGQNVNTIAGASCAVPTARRR